MRNKIFNFFWVKKMRFSSKPTINKKCMSALSRFRRRNINDKMTNSFIQNLYTFSLQLPYYAYLYQKDDQPIVPLKHRWSTAPEPGELVNGNGPLLPGPGPSSAMAAAVGMMGMAGRATFTMYTPPTRPLVLVRILAYFTTYC